MLSKTVKENYILIAKNLKYPMKFILKLEKAETIEECERLMIDARHFVK